MEVFFVINFEEKIFLLNQKVMLNRAIREAFQRFFTKKIFSIFNGLFFKRVTHIVCSSL